MNLTLPDSIQVWVETQASKAGKTPDQYILDVLRAARARESDPDDWLRDVIADACGEEAVTPEAVEKCKRGIEAKLLEGLDSGPATPMTGENWAALRQRVQQR